MFVKPFPLSDSCRSMLIFEGIINQNVLLNKVNLTGICLQVRNPAQSITSVQCIVSEESF